MKIELRRIFNIFHRRTISPAIGALAIVLLILSFPFPSIDSFKRISTWCTLLLIPVLTFIHTSVFPDELIIENRTIKYREFFKTGRRRKRYERYYATRPVTSFKFRQNFIEKLFNVGHIHFICRTYTFSKDDYYKVTIYGIPDFDTKKEEIERYFRQQEFESNFENF